MLSFQLELGNCFTIDNDVVVRVTEEFSEDYDSQIYVSVDAPDGVPVVQGESADHVERSKLEALRARFSDIVQRLAAEIPMDTSEGQELVGSLFSEFALAIAEQQQHQQRRQRQSEAVNAAKARGVRFGRQARPLPDNFEEAYRAWRNGEASLQKAAESCGLAKSTFYGVVTRMKD